MKAYLVDRKVSVWVGNFQTEDEFNKCIDTEVTPRLGLDCDIEDTCEAAFEPMPVPIPKLIEGFSGWQTFSEQAKAAAAARGISSANAALICYYVQCEDAPEHWGRFDFLGTFVGQDVT